MSTIAKERKIRVIKEAVDKNCCEENRLFVGCTVMIENDLPTEDIAAAYGIGEADVLDNHLKFNRMLGDEYLTSIESENGVKLKKVSVLSWSDKEEGVVIGVSNERKLVNNYLKKYLK